MLLAISAVLVLVTGKAVNNFVPGMVINAVGFVVMLVSILVRWPLIGLIVGLLFGDTGGLAKGCREAAHPDHRDLALGRVVRHPPGPRGSALFREQRRRTGRRAPDHERSVYALFLWATWLLVRGVYAGSRPDDDDDDAVADRDEP